MNRIAPQDLAAFLRKFRLNGGRIRRVRVLYPKPKQVALEFHLTVRETVKTLGTDTPPVQLVLRLEGVDEFRLQMRPGMAKSRIADARLGYLNGLFFVNFDAWGLDPGEQPKLHDYRASEAYAAGRELFWEEKPREKTPDTQTQG
jgi:hypothetical protein